MKKRLRRNELIKVFDSLQIFLYFFRHDANTSSSNENAGKLQTNAQVSRRPLSLTKRNEKQQNDEKDAPDMGIPQLRKNLGASSRDELPTTSKNKKEVWLLVSERRRVIKY